MGFLADLVSEKRSALVDLSNLHTPKEWLLASSGGFTTAAGAVVSQKSAMTLTAVYAAVRIIAWTMASMPLHVYSPDGRGKKRATDDPVYKLLHDSPNSEMTSFKWREFMFSQMNLWGAGISEIEFNGAGEPVALWPIPTSCVTAKRTYNTHDLVYEVTVDGSYRTEAKTYYLSPEQVVIFPALSTSVDGWLSPIAQHRETLGAAMATKEFGARTFGQGVNPAGILSGLKFPTEVSEDSIRKKYSENYGGLSNSHRLMLLEEGTKFERIGLPPQDAQYLESRRFDIAEVARIYNVPLHLLQEVSGTTSWGSGIEELNIGFVTYTLTPYAVLSEQEIKKKLLFTEGQFAEFLFAGLLRGKLSERVAAYAVGRQWGWYSANDVKELENQNPLPEDQGDIYLVPMNMINAKDAGKAPVAPKPGTKNPIDDKTTEEV